MARVSHFRTVSMAWCHLSQSFHTAPIYLCMFGLLCTAGCISCASAAAVLDLPQPECQLLLGHPCSCPQQATCACGQLPWAAAHSPGASAPTVFVPDGTAVRSDARKPETQDHWPEPQTNNVCGEGVPPRQCPYCLSRCEAALGKSTCALPHDQHCLTFPSAQWHHLCCQLGCQGGLTNAGSSQLFMRYASGCQ